MQCLHLSCLSSAILPWLRLMSFPSSMPRFGRESLPSISEEGEPYISCHHGHKQRSIVAHVTKRQLSWYGHIRQRDTEYITRMVLDKDIPGKRPRGRLRIRWMDSTRRIEIIWPRRPNDGRQEGVVKDGGNGRHKLVYKTQGEKVRRFVIDFSSNYRGM